MKIPFASLLVLTAVTATSAEDDAAFQNQLMDTVVSDCKGRFLSTLPTLYPGGEPGRALDQMTIEVCLDFAHFLPRKSFN